MARKRMSFFWVTIISFVTVYLFLKFVTPLIFRGVKGGSQLIPLPGTGMLMYTLLLILAVFSYVSFSAKKFADFYEPIVRFLAKGNTVPYCIVIGLVPLFIGWGVYTWVSPKTVSPTGIRIQHPALPGKFGKLENPFRNPSEDEIKKFIEAEGLGNLSMEAAKLALIEKYTDEGRGLYQMNCHPCHGCAADGNGPLANGFRLRPINFTDPGAISTVVETYVFWRAKEGHPVLPPESTPWDSAMPAWKYDYTDEQIWKIAMAVYDIAHAMPRKPEGAEH